MYQFILFPAEVPFKFVLLAKHNVAGVAVTEVGAPGKAVTVNVEPLVTEQGPVAVVTTILPVPLAPAGKFKVIVVGVTVVTGAAVPLIVTVVLPLT